MKYHCALSFIGLTILALSFFGAYNHLVSLSHATSISIPDQPKEVVGIMRCVPEANFGSDFYDMYGCKTVNGVLSFVKFFEKYRQSSGNFIIDIKYDSVQNLVHFYYGSRWG
jgi:hypothetical protein